MKKLEVLGMFVIIALVYLISSINSSFSVSTYNISGEGEFFILKDTYVRTNNFYCKSFIDRTTNESRIYRSTTELIKMPEYASSYLFVVKNINKQTGNCEIYEYSAPELTMTCTSTHLNSNDNVKCDLYVKQSNYGLDAISLIKKNNDLKIIDFDSINFNMNEVNNEYTFIPKTIINNTSKILVGTINIANTSISDGKDNILTFENILIKDSLTSFKVNDINQLFKESIGNGYDESTKTTSVVELSPKTDIEYKSEYKNKSSKEQVRNIIILFFIIVITSINMGFIVIFFYKRRENKETT